MTVAKTQQDRKYYAVGVGAMLLVVLLLGLRSKEAVQAVLNDRAPELTAETERPELVVAAVRGVAARDSMVAVAHLDAKLRDPFARDKKAPKSDRPVRRPQRVAKVIRPALSALIFDEVHPTVQITIEGERSDWLGTGDKFRGWQVAEILARSVKVKKGDKEIVLIMIRGGILK